MSTAGTIKRRTLLTGTNNPAYQASKDWANDSLVIASAAPDTAVMVRDSANADGWGFLTLGAGLLVVGNTLTAAGGAAAGSDTQVTFNDGGASAGDPGLTFNKTTDTLTAGIFAGSGASLTSLPAANLTGALPAISGASLTNLPAANLTGILAAISGANLTSLNATQLTSGTIPDGRFPATLPAISGVNLTALNATQLTSGTIPDARFPAALPAISGAALTNLPSAVIGATTQVAFNDAGTMAGDAGFTYNKTTDVATLVGGLITPSITRASGNLTLQTTTSGTIIVDGFTEVALRVNGTNVARASNASFLLTSGVVVYVSATGAIANDGYYEGTEMADPAAPAANKGRLYFKDNGSGKTQLAVRFPTGVVQIVATEP